jgi:Domain of unknown function (DUF4157)
LQRKSVRSDLLKKNKRLAGTFRIKEASWLARIAACVLRGRTAAIVFGNRIHLYGISKPDFLADEKFLRHELKHVEQYQRLGRSRFLFLYVLETLRHGYYNNPFEAEARSAESDTAIIGRFRLQ